MNAEFLEKAIIVGTDPETHENVMVTSAVRKGMDVNAFLGAKIVILDEEGKPAAGAIVTQSILYAPGVITFFGTMLGQPFGLAYDPATGEISLPEEPEPEPEPTPDPDPEPGTP